MKKRKRQTGYIQRVLEKYSKSKLSPGVYDITIRHDDWCKRLKGRGDCNCVPNIEDPKEITDSLDTQTPKE